MLENRFNALQGYPFELHEGIKCDILKVSKVVSIFFKNYFKFQFTLQNLPIVHIVRK
jgi:hypothetical protein